MVIKRLKICCLVLGFIGLVPTQAFAATTYSSPNYSVQQIFFGAGGSDNQASSNYNSRISVGELGIGNYSSSNYQAYAGFNTTGTPFLEFVVTGSSINLGYLSTTSTNTATGTFYIRAWQSGGYTVYTTSPPPTNAGGYSLATPSTPTASTIGSEQFGVNLVANSVPSSLGTNPQDAVTPNTCPTVASCVGSNYDTANKYMYSLTSPNNEIAFDSSSTSSIVYTLSFIFNISKSSPSGQYVFNSNLVAVADY